MIRVPVKWCADFFVPFGILRTMETAAFSGGTEFWQRGPVPGIPDLLQPVAHTLLQVKQEIGELAVEIDPARLWERPVGIASAGFHLLHMTGVLERLFAYADGLLLTPAQLALFAAENGDETKSLPVLVESLDLQIGRALEQLAHTDPSTLTELRYVGRKKIPSTLIGLYFHSAEHLMRHTGQLLVTVRGCLKDKY